MRLKLTFLLPALILRASAAEPAPAAPLSHVQQQQTLTQIADLIRDEYVFPDLAKTASEALRARAEVLVTDEAADSATFITKINAELKALTNDKHVSLRKAIPNFDRPTETHGIQKVERLKGDVGYLKVDRFFQADESRQPFDSAMNQLSGCKAMIIDLRENRGGGSANMLLASYFLSERTLVNTLHFRKAEPMEFWAGPSNRAAFTNIPVYILVSRITFSASEGLAYGLQQRGRAVLVGERTKGGANPNRFFAVGHGLELSLSVGRTVNPVSGTNWEGTGIQPDVIVPAEKALETACTLAAAHRGEGGRREIRTLVAGSD